MISIILLPDEGKFGHNKKKFEDAEAPLFWLVWDLHCHWSEILHAITVCDENKDICFVRLMSLTFISSLMTL
jgi:hypothetical protein